MIGRAAPVPGTLSLAAPEVVKNNSRRRGQWLADPLHSDLSILVYGELWVSVCNNQLILRDRWSFPVYTWRYMWIIFWCVWFNMNIHDMYVKVTQLPISICVDIRNRHIICAPSLERYLSNEQNGHGNFVCDMLYMWIIFLFCLI